MGHQKRCYLQIQSFSAGVEAKTSTYAFGGVAQLSPNPMRRFSELKDRSMSYNNRTEREK